MFPGLLPLPRELISSVVGDGDKELEEEWRWPLYNKFNVKIPAFPFTSIVI